MPLLPAHPASAVPTVLRDDNTQVTIDPSSPSGLSEWSIDGVNHAALQWFWYRVGDGTTINREISVDTLALETAGTTDTNFDGDHDTLFTRYLSPNLFSLEITWRVDGGTTGDGSCCSRATVCKASTPRAAAVWAEISSNP